MSYAIGQWPKAAGETETFVYTPVGFNLFIMTKAFLFFFSLFLFGRKGMLTQIQVPVNFSELYF